MTNDHQGYQLAGVGLLGGALLLALIIAVAVASVAFAQSIPTGIVAIVNCDSTGRIECTDFAAKVAQVEKAFTLTQNVSGGVMVSWDDAGNVRVDWRRVEEAVSDKDRLTRDIARLMIAIRDGKYQAVGEAK